MPGCLAVRFGTVTLAMMLRWIGNTFKIKLVDKEQVIVHFIKNETEAGFSKDDNTLGLQ